MNCFEVGFKVCKLEKAYNVDDIPAISQAMASSIKDDDREAFSNWFKDVQSATYVKFLKDVEMEFNKEKNFKHILAETLPFSMSKSKLQATENRAEGYKIHLPYHRFVEYNIKSLGFVTSQADTSTVQVRDLLTNSTIYSQNFNLVEGYNEIEVNHVIDNNFQKEIFIGVYIRDSFFEMSCSDIKETCGCLVDCESTYCEESNYMIQDNTPLSNKFFCLNATLQCNFEKMICAYKTYFYEAFKHAVAIQLLEEKITSYKRGWFSEANNQTIKETVLPELKEYTESLIRLGVSNVRGITQDSVCWGCEGIDAEKPLMQSYV